MLTTRFAPSPTGRLHLGHAYSAWFAWNRSREAGGRFLLRIEDIDSTRCKPEFTDGILEDLAWLGLSWEEPVRVQSQHLDDYAEALANLEKRGFIYPCFCTRREILDEIAAAGGAPHGAEGPVYPGTCKRLTEAECQAKRENGDAFALRLDADAALAETGPLTWRDAAAGEIPAAPRELGDVVLARKDIGTSYHLAVTVDDALQDISLVTRGQDLFHATHVHRVLQALLDLPTPRYEHHRLLTDESGRRFAKRDQSQTLHAMRQSGMSPEQVFARFT